MPFEPKLRFLKIIWRVISFLLGGGRSIQLSYRDIPIITPGTLPKDLSLPGRLVREIHIALKPYGSLEPPAHCRLTKQIVCIDPDLKNQITALYH